MKTIFFAGLVALSLFLVACGPNLPPEPGAPGTVAGGALAGRAGEDLAEMFAVDALTVSGDPRVVLDSDLNRIPDGSGTENDPYVIILSEETAGLNFQVTLAGDELCWLTGYYASETVPDTGWTGVPFAGTPIGDSGWARCGTSGVSYSMPVSSIQPGMNALIGYSCSKGESGWDCNGNRWRMTIVQAGITPEPETGEVIPPGPIPCTTDTDCETGFICESVPVSESSEEAAHYCVPLPETPVDVSASSGGAVT